MIVVDANVVIYLVFETTFTRWARDVYARDPDWVVPDLWEAEVLNGLLNEVRAGHTRVGDALVAAGHAATLLAGRAHKCDREAVLRVAYTSRLTAYDAHYVVLARALGVKLVTEDRLIKRRCPEVAMSLKAFLGLSEEPPAVREKRAVYRTRRKVARKPE
jgi:predicted nucleic acid-binding protein